MKGLFEGKTPTERNKMIAAAALGVVALFALYFAFGRGGSTTTATVTIKISPTPTPGGSSTASKINTSLPTMTEQDFVYQTTQVVSPGPVYPPDPGRNIFAFYEPPEPCRGDSCPSPLPPPPSPIKSPSPTPTAPMQLDSVNPMSVYAGARDFRIEVSGDRYTPEARIYFNQSEVPTTFINTQKLVANVPAKFISTEGPRQIIVQTPDGKAYSNQLIMSVMAPPKPTVLYIGMIGRKRYNNDTAYLAENEKALPFGARLNDVIGGRFRLVDISPAEVVFEDVNLGFKHKVPISKGLLIGSPPPGRGIESEPGIPNYAPGMPLPGQNIPGIPNNIQPSAPPNPEQRKMEQQKMEKKDVDDNGDG